MSPSPSAPVPPIFTFRARLPQQAVSRDLEVAANQTLLDLGDAIPAAFGFTDSHLWSFFLSGRPWDPTTEYARQGRSARLRIDQVPWPGRAGKREVLFLFDYGDEWHFGLKLLGTSEAIVADVSYPRVVAGVGQAPPQYPELDARW